MTHPAGRSALVTGGGGFIGHALVRRLLDDGVRVAVVDAMVEGSGANARHRDAVQDRVQSWQDADLARETGWEAALEGVDTIFHLAAQISHASSMEDPLADLSANAAGTLRVLEAARVRAPAARVVFSSTRQVYGRTDGRPVPEDRRPVPPDVNAIHKLAAEEYCRLYGRTYGLQGAILRLTNTYGPGMRVRDARQTFLGHWIRLALDAGEIPIFGDGSLVRDLTYVDDAVAALLAAAGVAAGTVPTYNVGGEPRTLGKLAELVVAAAGTGTYRLVPFPPERARIDIGSFQADDSALRDATGWAPRVTLEEGVRRTLEYYRRYRADYWNPAS